MKYRLGLDVGTNSLGWCIVKLNEQGNPNAIEKLGVRIFSDGRNPKDQTTLASQRRLKRGERRRRDRFKQRKNRLISQLVRMGLFPALETEQESLKSLNVLALRAQAINQEINSYELGRVFYHLNLRRGFKSNRKSANPDDTKNKVSDRIETLKKSLKEKNLPTVGAFLYDLHKQGKSTNATVENGFYFLRNLLEDEFDLIVSKQQEFRKNITEQQWKKLRGYIFYQRPLKLVETGKCPIYSDKNRTYKYAPSFENYRLLADLFNLSYQDNESYKTIKLDSEQVIKAFHEFKNTKEIRFSKIRSFLKMPKDVKFTIEKTNGKEKIKNSVTNAFFSQELIYGKAWDSIPLEMKDKIALAYFADEETDFIKRNLKSLNVKNEIIDVLFDEDTQFPSGFSDSTCTYSAEVLQRIVELVLEEKCHPSFIIEALTQSEKSDKTHDRLEYYGKVLPESLQPIPEHIKRSNLTLNQDEKEFGKIANPTVHAALNQIRRVVNELVAQYGKPSSIHIEFARELKQSQEERLQQSKRSKDNEKSNEMAKQFILDCGEKITLFNLERARLWYELDALKNQFCVYSGKPISAGMVLTDAIEVDHILPWSQTLDDSRSNKVLVLASENRIKKNQTPFQAFSDDSEKWAGIQERVKLLPYNKQWRFAEDALKQFQEKHDFLERHLNDTRYISKIAKKYLGSLIDTKNIVASKGTVTSIVRGKLGINKFVQNEDGSKNRNDHRHHAVDALAIALTSRSYLKKMSDLSAQNNDPNKILIEEPWKCFYKDAENKFNEIVVSHKIDHGKNGPFMEETSFGLIEHQNSYEVENGYQLVTTKPKEVVDNKKFETIRDPFLRKVAMTHGKGYLDSNIKRLRVYEVSKEKTKDIGSLESGLAKIFHGRKKQHAKLYQKGDINYLAIWRLPKEISLNKDANAEGGKKQKARKTDYIFTAVKTFDLNSRCPNELKPHPAAKLVAKIYKGDTVAVSVNNNDEYFIVKSIKAAGKQLAFLNIHKQKKSEEEKEFTLAFAKLVENKFRKVYVSPSGKILDRGPILK